jgi:hypothetical protein
MREYAPLVTGPLKMRFAYLWNMLSEEAPKQMISLFTHSSLQAFSLFLTIRASL